MTGEVRDETNLSTAEIANPTTPRSQYQSRDTSTATEVLDNEVLNNPRDVERTRTLVPEQAPADDKPGQLFPDNELNELRARWDKAQIGFVDEPRAAVEQADSLVATVVKRIAEQFAAERAELEHQWDRGDNVSTEDLRQALRRYRSFFDRLLAF
jgi:phytoene dehydrogenase-like protein